MLCKLIPLFILCLMTISDIFAQNKNVTSTVIPNKNHVGPYIMTDTIRRIDAPFSMAAIAAVTVSRP